ncbi:UDP-GlcNAc:betaGal beta-1,3-N-acetylglucosaminyltransferase-like protein 1 [Branchiostoma belcheri]|nr:UDP-GlcNAc:betaGal beta-1,3-N-acetylglucosaminyltransferase-like protein 1 [Branchiostoma belcheri]
MAAVGATSKTKEPCVDVSVIMPVHNAAAWLQESLQSVLLQTFRGCMEMVIFNDASKDSSLQIIEDWRQKFESAGILMTVGGHDSDSPRGDSSSSLTSESCTQDDVMHPRRVELQYETAVQHQCAIVGCRVHREPDGSTDRYTRWINSITPEQLTTQIYTANGPTVVMPTWFCARSVWDRVGGFNEGGKGVPEDLIFFLEHLRLGGQVIRVDEHLLTYRYHPQAATASVHRETIWNIQLAALQDRVLVNWSRFTIWNAGKQGRRFYRDLSKENKAKVAAFCDVDVKKIEKGFYTYEESRCDVNTGSKVSEGQSTEEDQSDWSKALADSGGKDSATYRLDQWRTLDPPPPKEALQSPCESLPYGTHLPRRKWAALNRARCGVGRTRDNLLKWGRVSSADCPCGHPTQTMQHILQDCEFGPSVTKQDLYNANQEALDWLGRQDMMMMS